jgi:hypothetical protein
MRKFITALALALLAALIPMTAMACPPEDPLCAGFSYTTSGTITGECPSALDGSLSFTGVTGDVTDPRAINLGYFSLSNIENDGSGTFNLTVNFTLPAGVQDPSYPGMPVTFTEDWQWFFWSGPDSVSINLNNTVKHLTFTGGSFDFWLPADTLEFARQDSQSDRTLWGRIGNVQCDTASIPEPGSIVLFGTLLSGLCLFLGSAVGLTPPECFP